MTLSGAGRRRKGHAFLGSVVGYLREHGFAGAVMTAPGDHTDVGDVSGLDGWVVEVKNHRELSLGEWATQAERAAVASRRYRWAVIAKRVGKSAVKDSYVVLPLRCFAELVKRDDEAYVWTSPGRLGGEPCIGGTRVSTETVAGMAASGSSVEDIASDYDLTPRQVLVACWYEARNVADERYTRWSRWAANAHDLLRHSDAPLPEAPPPDAKRTKATA